jgi:hypothetical protein
MQKYTDVVTSARSGAAKPDARVTVKTYPGAVIATIYSDDGVTTQDNPITTDSNGEFYFYAADGEYTLTVSGTGITERTIGPIILHDPTDADDYMLATDVSFTQSGTAATSRTAQAKMREWVSVQDFGVVGDGSTDDTTAMRAAIAAVKARNTTYQPTDGTATVSRVHYAPGLFIPGGMKIHISDTLEAPLTVMSDGHAVIKQTGTNKAIFVGDDQYEFFCYGIVFEGGTHAATLNNDNLNAGIWYFEDCDFALTTDYAIEAVNNSVSWDVTSTVLRTKNCRWLGCNKAIYTECDHTFIDDFWIALDEDTFTADTAAIYNGGYLKMTNGFALPFAQGATNPSRARWIDNHGAVSCRSVRFGLENAGIPIVYHHAAPVEFNSLSANSVQAGINFEDCLLGCGADASADSAVINCRGEIPMKVSITNSHGIPSGRALILVESAANGGIDDVATYISDFETATGQSAKLQLFYNYSGNNFILTTNERMWPEELDLYTTTGGGRATPRVCKLVRTSNQTASSGQTLVEFDATPEYDPYGMQETGAVEGVRAPPYSKWARISGYVEIASHTANNLIYNVRLYKGSNSIPDAYVNYLHEITGIIRIQISGEVEVTSNDLLSIRFTQSSGTDKTISRAALTVEFP